MGFLTLLIIGALIWAFARNPLDSPKVKTKIYEINKQWGDFIAGYHRLARTDEERAVTERMLRDLQSQGMPVSDVPTSKEETDMANGNAAELAGQPAGGIQAVIADSTVLSATAQLSSQQKTSVDNTSILLNFGAFLLIAAAGLFVGFGGATGGVRTFIVALVAAVFYCVGFWLWYDRPNLKQVALTFVGIGIVLAPLAGVAAYSYVFRESGAVVWFVTSTICLALYAHAASAIKHALLDYILIGTFVSLFESSIAVLNLPAYYYGWGLAAVGLLLQASQAWRKQPFATPASSALSANILLPLSLFVSLNMVASHGALQLAIALVLAAAYYGLMGWNAIQPVRLQAFTAAESLLLAAGVFFAYSVQHSFADSAVALVLLAVPQMVWLLLRSHSDMALRAGRVLLCSLGLAVLLAQESEVVVLGAMLALAVAGAFVWLTQRRVGTYIVAILSTIGALFVGTYSVWSPADPGFVMGILSLVLILGQVGLFYLVHARVFDTPNWRMWFQGMIVTSALAGLLSILAGNAATFSLPVQTLVYVGLVGLVWTLLIMHDDARLWTVLTGFLPFIPLLLLMTRSGAYDRPGLYAATAVGTLLWNIGLSAWQKTEQTRAFVTVTALILPISIASLTSSVDGAVFYTGMYSVVMVGLLCARFVAVQSSAVSQKKGISYAVGAAVAAVLALCIAPIAHDRLLSVTTAFTVGVAVIIAARFVEKLPLLVSLLPFVVQIGIWSTYVEGQLVAYAAVSTLAAALGYYLYVTSLKQIPHSEGYYVHYASLATSYIPVMVYLGAASAGTVVWVLPWAVLLATVTTLHAVWNERQNIREAVGGIVAFAVMLVLYYYGLRNVQIYAHVTAALLALYAYWRWRRAEHAKSDSYVTATLAVVTVPLVLQALGGVAGDLYGWWLLIEQIVIMLLGMVLKKKFMVRWGLYVSLAAVLYQLRHLGWAALAVLAVFLIGLAIFRLQRSGRSTPPEVPPAS